MRTLAGFSLIINLLGEFIIKITKAYMDKLMKNKEFREKSDKEYQNLCIEINRDRHLFLLTSLLKDNRRKLN